MYLEISYRSPWSNVEVSSHRRRTIGTSPSRFEMPSMAGVNGISGGVDYDVFGRWCIDISQFASRGSLTKENIISLDFAVVVASVFEVVVWLPLSPVC